MKRLLKAFVKKIWDLLDWVLKKRNVSLNSRITLRQVVKEVAKEFYHGGALPPAISPASNLANVPIPEAAACNCKKILGRQISVPGKKRFLVDVSQLVVVNAKSGIQRVVIRVLDAMLEDDRYVYVPIGLWNGTMHYVEYHQDDCTFHVGELMEIQREDTLLMLDSSWEYYRFFWGMFEEVHAKGGKVYVTVYDLIPLLQSQYVANRMPQLFEYWLKSAVNEADGLICISHTVATQLRDYIRQNPTPQYAHPLKLGHFVLGADFIETGCQGVPPEVADIFARIGNRKKFISVSTLEPRKNYDFMLSVMEKLWERGFDVVYFIVGKHGWNVDDLIDRITHHPELNKRLFWFQRLEDGALLQLYQASDILLNLSHGEGYGLSLVEGAHYQCSIIASDIPVFREVITDDTTLFCNIDSLDETVNAIAAKLEKNEFVPSKAKYNFWNDALNDILDSIYKKKWDFEVGKSSNS